MIDITQEIKEKFPGLEVQVAVVKGLKIQKKNTELENYKKKVAEDIKRKKNLEKLKDDPVYRKYRDFFWKISVDPTKIRPASEALTRRVLQGKPLPEINTGVDAYNMASIETGVPLAAFDSEKIQGKLKMRFAREGEEFLGIGMNNPKELKGKEVVIEDSGRVTAIYPYRDADYSKITPETKKVLLISCGAPGISSELLKKTIEKAKKNLERFSC